jgi:hypothetical protein
MVMPSTGVVVGVTVGVVVSVLGLGVISFYCCCSSSRSSYVRPGPPIVPSIFLSSILTIDLVYRNIAQGQLRQKQPK